MGPVRLGRWVFLVVCCLACTTLGWSQTRAVAFNNTASDVGEGSYQWTVYVDADAVTLSHIRSVEYTLHPTFPNPVRTVSTRENKFALSAIGWGEFTIYAKVYFTDGTAGSYRYRLNLAKATRPSSSVEQAPRDLTKRVLTRSTVKTDTMHIATGNTSRRLQNGSWEWTVFIIASNEVLQHVQYVEYTLHPTFSQPIQRVTQRGLESGRGFALKATGWGTFEIAIKVVFTNGTKRYLKHPLKFG